MSKFISIEEAHILTGKANATIRKAINMIKNKNKDHVIEQPYKGAKGYKIYVQKDALLEALGLDTKEVDKKTVDSEYVKHLEAEVAWLREQIAQSNAKNDYLVKVLGEKIKEDEKFLKLKE